MSLLAFGGHECLFPFRFALGANWVAVEVPTHVANAVVKDGNPAFLGFENPHPKGEM